MAVLEIVKEGHPVLRKKAEPVTQVTKRIRKLVKDNAGHHVRSQWVGLAVPKWASARIIVVDVGDGPELCSSILKLPKHTARKLTRRVSKHSRQGDMWKGPKRSGGTGVERIRPKRSDQS